MQTDECGTEAREEHDRGNVPNVHTDTLEHEKPCKDNVNAVDDVGVEAQHPPRVLMFSSPRFEGLDMKQE